MVVCLCFDDNYFIHGFDTISSLLEHYSRTEPLHLYVLSMNYRDQKVVSNSNVSLLEKLVKMYDQNNTFTLIDYTDEMKKRNIENVDANKLTIFSCFRLSIPDLIPHDKTLYLDSDLIFVNDGIEELYNISFDDTDLVAIIDATIEFNCRHERIKLMPYINSGVLVFNNILLRNKPSSVDRCFNHIVSVPHHWPDQTTINLCMNIKRLPRDVYKKFNIDRYNDDTIVLHFYGKDKPWHDKYQHGFDSIEFYAYKKYHDIYGKNLEFLRSGSGKFISNVLR